MSLSRHLVSTALLMMALALPAAAERRGVTLHTDTDRGGESEKFTRDEADLSGTRVGGRRARSVSVDRGCVATLFSRRNFRGRQVELREDDNDLSNTQVRDGVQSLTIRCGGRREGPRNEGYERNDGYQPSPPPPPVARGVTLFRDRDLEGPSETFSTDVPDLSRTRFGDHKASSIRVPRGCVAILYEEPGYRGRHTQFRDDDHNLKNTAVGEDRVSSLRVDCGGR